MDAARNLKVNLKLNGETCLACKTALELGTDASVCTACEGNHHARCWNSYGGCATPGCANAPLKRLDAPVYNAPPPPPPLAAGMMHCPACRNVIMMGDPLCPYCRAITSPDGIYHGPKVNAPGAVQSLVFGIIGLLICGVIFGPLAISRSSSAKREIAMNPTYGGGGLATAGMVLGILDLVAWGLILMVRMGSR
ncbi:MAG: DUF4190 domain-containing protein [Myxococcales bacterium]|nr:DUF4190 domain-containing protein [Myxococcales bacterium]